MTAKLHANMIIPPKPIFAKSAPVIRGQFRNRNGDLESPERVDLNLRSPSGATTDYANITPADIGTYDVQVFLIIPGEWLWTWTVKETINSQLTDTLTDAYKMTVWPNPV